MAAEEHDGMAHPLLVEDDDERVMPAPTPTSPSIHGPSSSELFPDYDDEVSIPGAKELGKHVAFAEFHPTNEPSPNAKSPRRRGARSRRAHTISQSTLPQQTSQRLLPEFKPFSAQSVIHSLFQESKLDKRAGAIEELDTLERPTLSPATNDPLLNPAAEVEVPAEEPAPAPRKKGKIRWSKYIPYVWVVCMCIILFGFLPYGIYIMHETGSETYVQAWFIAGVFVCVAVPISIWDVAQHMRHWYDPPLQKPIVRILWMVPIYAIDSWFALRFVSVNIYIDAARECYEAYVIYNFYLYLLIYLRKNPDFDATLADRPVQRHLWPIHWVKPWPMGQVFLNECTKGVTSYIIIRPATTIAAFFLQMTDSYDEGELRYDRGYAYVALINSISQGWAIYCLVLFYLAFKHDLAATKPLYKFLTIKAIVFLSFWQAVFIAFLVYIGVIEDDPRWQQYNKENVAMGLQDFLVCVEMFVASLVHHYVFSFEMYVRDKRYKERLTYGQQFHHIFDVSDLKRQVVEMVTGDRSTSPKGGVKPDPAARRDSKLDDVDNAMMLPPSSRPVAVV